MAKWSRTKDNLKAQVIESKILNPDKTLRELEEELIITKTNDIVFNEWNKYILAMSEEFKDIFIKEFWEFMKSKWKDLNVKYINE